MNPTAHALVYRAPREAGIEPVRLAPMAPGMVEVRTIASGLSRGTERLVFEGRVPRSQWQSMRAPLQVGDFPFPVRYGYAAAGVVTEGPAALTGAHVFALHPHQDRFRLPEDRVVPLPPGVSPERAVLAANMETALNAIWDAGLRPGSRCLVVGAGLLGWLIAALLSRRADLQVDVTDIRAEAGATADDFSVTFLTPEAVPQQAYDVAFHTSATGAGLQRALDSLRIEGQVVELSWYGDRPVEILLGGAFHAGRLRIVSSQVGRVAPSRRASLTHRDRLGLALAALSARQFDALVTTEVRFADLPDRLPELLGVGAPGIATRILYP